MKSNTGYKGIVYVKDRKKYRVTVYRKGFYEYLGLFDSLEEAIRIYQAATNIKEYANER